MSNEMKLSVIVEASVGAAKKALQDFQAAERQIGVEAQRTNAVTAAAADVQVKNDTKVAASVRMTAAELAKLRAAYAQYLADAKAGANLPLTMKPPVNAGVQLASIYNKLVPDAKKLGDLDTIEVALGKLNRAGAVDAETFALLSGKLAASRAALNTAEKDVGGVAGALSHLSLTSGGAAREYGVLLGELARGNYTRLEGSLLTLSNRVGLLPLLFSGAGAAITGGVAIVGLLTAAFVKGEQEDGRYNAGLLATGNYAGSTLSSLRQMAQGFTTTNTTIGQSKEVLADLVQSGRFTEAQMRTIGPAALQMAQLTGRSIEQTVKIFEDLQKSPAKVVKELNDQYHFLDLATYDRIAALEKEGHAEQAAELAQQTFAAALKTRTDAQVKNLGIAERAWDSVRKAASSAWDAFLGIGKAETANDRLASLEARLKGMRTITTGRGSSREMTDAEIDQNYTTHTRAGTTNTYRGLEAQAAALRATTQADAVQAQKDSDKAVADQAAIDNEAAAEKLQAIRAAAAGREMAWRIAHLAAVAELQKANDNAERTQLEAKLKTGEISYAAYYQRLAALSKTENDAQIKTLQAQLGQNAEKRGAVAGKPGNNAGERIETASRLNELDAERETIQGRINVLQAESSSLADDFSAKADVAIGELAKKVEDAAAKLQTLKAAIAPEDLPARLDAIANEVRTKYAGLADDVRVNARQLKAMGVDIDVVMKLIDADTTKQQVDAQIDSIEKNVAAAQARFQNQQLISASRVQTGNESQGQARGEVQSAAKVDMSALPEARTMVLELLNNYPDNPKLAEVLKTINGDIKDLGHIDDSPFKVLIRSWADTTNQLKSASASWTQGFADQLTNLLTKGKADFKGFALSILSDIAKILVEKEIAGIVSMVVGFSEGGLVQGYAGGGHVNGPGSSTSDSIPAWLSDGEYVINAKSVRQVGTRFLDSINGGDVAPTRAARFAGGGLVNSTATAASTDKSGGLYLAVHVPISMTGRQLDAADVQQLQSAMAPAMADTARAVIIEQQRPGGGLRSFVQ